MGNTFNKPTKGAEKTTETPSEGPSPVAKKCTNCKCSGKKDESLVIPPVPAAPTTTTLAVDEIKSTEPISKDVSSSMIVLHSDTPSESFTSVKSEAPEEVAGDAIVIVSDDSVKVVAPVEKVSVVKDVRGNVQVDVASTVEVSHNDHLQISGNIQTEKAEENVVEMAKTTEAGVQEDEEVHKPVEQQIGKLQEESVNTTAEEQSIEGNQSAFIEEPKLESVTEVVTTFKANEELIIPATAPAKELVYEFSIAGEKLKLNTAEDVAEQVAFINAHSEIKVVRLTGNTIGVDAGKALAAAVASLDGIQEFYLNDCFTSRMKEEVHVCVENFGKALKGKQQLATVDFSDNAFGPIGAKSASLLLAQATSLKELLINNCGLGPEGGKIIAQALLDCQMINKERGQPSNLRVVQMGRNRLEDGASPLLSEAFAALGALNEISMPQCGIRPEGTIALCSGISKNSNLHKLNLQDNTFTNEASIPLAKALGSLKQLQHLDIGDCMIGNEGCKAIIESLAHGDSALTLQALNLQYGEMNEEGALFLSQLLPKFQHLKVLMLNGNAFDPNGRAAEAIKDVLQLDQRADILDSWSDMDFGSDEEEFSEGEGEFRPKMVSTPIKCILPMESVSLETSGEVEDITEDLTRLEIKEGL